MLENFIENIVLLEMPNMKEEKKKNVHANKENQQVSSYIKNTKIQILILRIPHLRIFAAVTLEISL